MGDTTEELERFRQQWQEEVKTRSKAVPHSSTTKTARLPASLHSKSGHHASDGSAGAFYHKPYRDTEGYEDSGEHVYHDLEDMDNVRKLGETGQGRRPSSRQEPHSALEHYERAVERETEGSLGDSLSHYRKAYKLDAGVDRIYKNKHFPVSSFKSKPTNPNPSNAAVTVPNTAHHSLDGPSTSSISELLASLSSLSIQPAAPPTDASPPSPCPIAKLPSEILTYILFQSALTDVASFSRLSLVCKCLAYLVATEDRTWRRICLGPEVGFAGMHYVWKRTITGHHLPMSLNDIDEEEDFARDLSSLTIASTTPTYDPFPLSSTYPTYREMFHNRPRLRFNGCYISTVNYIRPGGNTTTQSTWNTPVHIVTYYRYLRFYRDGTCASLLTTTEPADVVHHLTKENMHTRHAGGLPSSVMNNCLRGRWKLSGDPYKKQPPTPPISAAGTLKPEQIAADDHQGPDKEGTVHIETEGADAMHPNPKYIYKMMLALKSAGKAEGVTRNNKLSWMGYWSYNKLTDDWAEFCLKNDKPFFWSRVRSYGTGE